MWFVKSRRAGADLLVLMAGTLPGVEAARRRRFHHGASDHSAGLNGQSWMRKSSSRHEFSSANSFSSSSMVRSTFYYVHDEKLGGAAKEAKERLDEKLRSQRKLLFEPFRHQKKETLRALIGEMHVMPPRHEEDTDQSIRKVPAIKRSGSKRLMGLGRTKLGWKASEQEECTICLDRFKTGDSLSHLPCAHRFHTKCVAPWIETNAHCPCCRMSLNSSISKTSL